MIYAAVAFAAVAAAIAAQGPRPPSTETYRVLDKNRTRILALEEAARLQHKQDRPLVLGKVKEVTPASQGLQRGPCGMPIIAADASVDPKFVIPTPGSETRETKTETVEPPPCGPFTVAPTKQPQAIRKR